MARQDGVVHGLPGVDVIRNLPSFQKIELAIQPGMEQKKTIDCFTRPGSVQLVHDDEAVVLQDYETIRQLEENGLFEWV